MRSLSDAMLFLIGTKLGAAVGLRACWLPTRSRGLLDEVGRPRSLSASVSGLLSLGALQREDGQSDREAADEFMSGLHGRLPLAGEMIEGPSALCERPIDRNVLPPGFRPGDEAGLAQPSHRRVVASKFAQSA